MTQEVRGLDVSEATRRERGDSRRRRALLDYIERAIRKGTFSITRGVLEEDFGLRTIFAELLSDLERDEKRRPRPSSTNLVRKPVVTLRTIDGRPFACPAPDARIRGKGIKVGLEQANAKQLVTLKMQGVDIVKRAEYPEAEFTVTAAEAFNLLTQYGYRCTLTRKHWHLYEVGGPLEAEVLAEYGPKAEPPKPTAEELFAKAEALMAEAEAIKAAEEKPKAAAKKAKG